jgi:hypothetical protein
MKKLKDGAYETEYKNSRVSIMLLCVVHLSNGLQPGQASAAVERWNGAAKR